MNSDSNLSFSDFDVDAKAAMKLPSYSEIRPHLVKPVKDVIKVINATCPKIGPNGVSLGCK